MTAEPIVVARGAFSALRELERVLKGQDIRPTIVAPPDCNTNS